MKESDFVEFMNYLLLEHNIFKSHLVWHKHAFVLPMSGALSAFLSNGFFTKTQIEELIKQYFPKLKVFISLKTLDMTHFILTKLKPIDHP